MTDQEAADAVRRCVKDLNGAILAASKQDLRVLVEVLDKNAWDIPVVTTLSVTIQKTL